MRTLARKGLLMTAAAQRFVTGAADRIAIEEHGTADKPAVLMTHSILSSSMMWSAQAKLLASLGWRVILADTRGHGASPAPPGPYTMADLVADTIAVLDALHIERAHYVGLSLGGMSGFGLGIRHPERLNSLCLCDARADAPPSVAAPWDERIAIACQHGCGALADSTLGRWFGTPFLEAHPAVARRFREIVAATSLEGFVGCARAIQSLDYAREDLARIVTLTTLIVGANDGVLPDVMSRLAAVMGDATLEVIPNAGHLPNVDNAAMFNAALLRHFERAVVRV
jgi:3-oxoadipate enol-lactonase